MRSKQQTRQFAELLRPSISKSQILDEREKKNEIHTKKWFLINFLINLLIFDKFVKFNELHAIFDNLLSLS